MKIYKCSNCGKTEKRSVGGLWEIECTSCTGMLTVELTGDYCICDRCGEQHEGHLRQCPNCKNIFLTNAYADEPLTNQSIIDNIKKNVSSQTKTLFHCLSCGKEQSFFTDTPMASFCSYCGELMEQHCVDLKTFRLSKRWSQRLFAEELNISRTYLVKLENGTRSITPEIARKVTKMASR